MTACSPEIKLAPGAPPGGARESLILWNLDQQTPGQVRDQHLVVAQGDLPCHRRRYGLLSVNRADGRSLPCLLTTPPGTPISGSGPGFPRSCPGLTSREPVPSAIPRSSVPVGQQG